MAKEGHLHRFFIRPECVSDDSVSIYGSDARQICSVLRLSSGDRIAALDGTGHIYTAEITKASPAAVVAMIMKKSELDTEPRVKIALAQSLPKGNKLEFILQKGTEIGVAEFQIMTSARTIPKVSAESADKKIVRWQRVVKEAAEQSFRARIPTVEGISSLEEVCRQIQNYDLAICLWEDESQISFKKLLSENSSAQSVLLIVGPEGGFEEKEAQMMQESGAGTATLGKRILRCETAAIVATAVVLHEMEA